MEKSGCIRPFLWFGLVVGILALLGRCHSSSENEFQKEIDLIATHWVPDHRVGICNIKSKSPEKGTLILTGETTSNNAKIEIINTLNKQVKVLVDSIILLPDSARNKKFMGLVTLSVVNLRKGPDHTSELVSQARLGTPVLILKDYKSWIQIQTPDKYISWTEKSSVTSMDRQEMTRWKNSSRVIYLESTGWLHVNPSANSGVIGDLVGGSIMVKTGELKGFVSIELPDGRKGYVDRDAVMDFKNWENTVSCSKENICDVAMSFLGLPYLWGGTSAKGVDCSGLVQSVFFMNGIILERDASMQAQHGALVDITHGYSRLEKGDLLCFGSKVNGTAHVTHIAIYLGNKEYINSSGRVMVNSLDSTQIDFNRNRTHSLLEAKRISGVENDGGIIPVKNHPWY
jgi:gamma-D-glutamyl-L-lysine dipeptidyl-peptidase